MRRAPAPAFIYWIALKGKKTNFLWSTHITFRAKASETRSELIIAFVVYYLTSKGSESRGFRGAALRLHFWWTCLPKNHSLSVTRLPRRSIASSSVLPANTCRLARRDLWPSGRALGPLTRSRILFRFDLLSIHNQARDRPELAWANMLRITEQTNELERRQSQQARQPRPDEILDVSTIYRQ